MAKTKLLEYLGSPLTVLFHTQEFKRAVTRITTCCGSSGGEIFLDAGDNVTITGTGTELDPFVISSENGGLQSVVAGTNITIDNTDPLNPIISAASGLTGTGTNNVLTKWTGATSLGNSLVSEDATTVKIGAVGSQPTYAFGVYGTTNGATISAIDNALSLESGNTSTSPALIVSRSNTSANIAEFAAPSGALVSLTSSGSVQSSALAGTGTRVTLTSSTGLLSALPNGTNTHVLTLVAGVPTWAAASGGSSGWALTGNAGTIAGTNFIGTTDNVDVVFKRNNTISGLLNSNNTGFGSNTIKLTATGVNNTSIGAEAGASITSGQHNTLIGYSAGTSSTSGGANVALGRNALYFNTSGNSNIAIGNQSAQQSTTSNDNIAIGQQASFGNNTGIRNIGIGTLALYSNTNSSNIGIGYQALYSNTTSTDNLAIGNESLLQSTGGLNLAIGNLALRANTTGNTNLAIGYYAGFGVTTGGTNIAIGRESLYTGGAGANNIAIGYRSLFNSTASNNTALGTNAGASLTTGTNNIVIGYNQQLPSASGNNQINIGGAIFATNANGSAASPAGQIGIGTTAPDTSSILDLTSTTRGFLPPRMTTTQKNAIPSPAAGLIVYDTTLNKLCVYTTAWETITSI